MLAIDRQRPSIVFVAPPEEIGATLPQNDTAGSIHHMSGLIHRDTMQWRHPSGDES